MYAIIEDGSHQFRVREGDRIQVDRRDGKAGDELVFSKVLFIAGGDGAATIGTPTIEGARVVAKIVNQFKAKKIIIQKFRRRKNMRRRNGHRQPYTVVQITSLRRLELIEPPASRIFPNYLNRAILPGFPAMVRFFHLTVARSRRWLSWRVDEGRLTVPARTRAGGSLPSVGRPAPSVFLASPAESSQSPHLNGENPRAADERAPGLR